MADHIHILVSIPPKYSIAQIVGFIKGKVQYQLPETTWDEGKTLQARNFGQEDIMCQQLERMKRI